MNYLAQGVLGGRAKRIKMTQGEIETKLEELRQSWKIATPINKKIIEMRAKLLKMSVIPKATQLTLEEINDIFISNNQGG